MEVTVALSIEGLVKLQPPANATSFGNTTPPPPNRVPGSGGDIHPHIEAIRAHLHEARLVACLAGLWF